ncbi:MAG: hypothetical protein K2N06_10625 [Oscillospiraceae bacterium]|nr:hypothetical protein [Oscillospiraceae bacterium]
MNMDSLCDITVYRNENGFSVVYFGFKDLDEPRNAPNGKVEITITDDANNELYCNEFQFDKDEFFIAKSADKDIYACDFKIDYDEIQPSDSEFCNFSFKFKMK